MARGGNKVITSLYGNKKNIIIYLNMTKRKQKISDHEPFSSHKGKKTDR